MDGGSYWMISVPAEPSKAAAWKQLSQKLTKEHSYSTNYRLPLPNLKIGTLDGLLALSDELHKTDAYCEAVVQRIVKIFVDLQKRREKKTAKGKQTLDKVTFQVEGVPYEQWLQNFEWDSGRYPDTLPLRDLIALIEKNVQALEEQVKERAQEYANAQSQLLQMERSSTGSLALRDLTGLVKESDFVETESLTTALVVVPKYQFKQFETEYATIIAQKIRDIESSFVVPRSHRRISEDKEHGLYTVVLFKRVYDDFVTACRQKRYIVREFTFSEGLEEGHPKG